MGVLERFGLTLPAAGLALALTVVLFGWQRHASTFGPAVARIKTGPGGDVLSSGLDPWDTSWGLFGYMQTKNWVGRQTRETEVVRIDSVRLCQTVGIATTAWLLVGSLIWMRFKKRRATVTSAAPSPPRAAAGG